MFKTKKFGLLEPIGYIDIRKVGGYDGLEKLLCSNKIAYEKDSISARSYSGFSGGRVLLSDKGFAIISTYSRLVNPRFISINSIYVYNLYIIKKDDFDKIKDSLPIKQ
jgi:hypothetical protein